MRLDAVIPALHQDDFSTVRVHRTSGRPREATSEEIEDKLQEYEDAQKGADNQG
ncbi:MAG: hypothetical protein HC879_18915 [Leptolyngbyaceae cyanobacterium SL_5_9]|nr:hypothetical protein [Leptolyngbyaceae cyanobacterium SL_5_9]NJO74354.1 hypothetical protein [Leptolyngbyaceae cyanobacterium RM1_406_9]